MVYKLKKNMYRLKQPPRQWYLKFDHFMHMNQYMRCEMDHCCYVKKSDSSYIILLLIVDEMLIGRSDMYNIKIPNKVVVKRIRDEGPRGCQPVNHILGMCIYINIVSGTLQLSQAKYIKKGLYIFNMTYFKSKSTHLGDNRHAHRHRHNSRYFVTFSRKVQQKSFIGIQNDRF